MTTEVRIKVLSLDYRLRQQIIDEINSKFILTIRENKSKYVIALGLDEDGISRESIISSLSEGVLEYIDTIDVFNDDAPEDIPEVKKDNPFKSAYDLVCKE